MEAEVPDKRPTLRNRIKKIIYITLIALSGLIAGIIADRLDLDLEEMLAFKHVISATVTEETIQKEDMDIVKTTITETVTDTLTGRE